MKMVKIPVLLLIAFVSVAVALPLETLDFNNEADAVLAGVEIEEVEDRPAPPHRIQRRFIDPFFSLGTPDTDDIVKMRTKRSYDECEKLQLCKLHARSRQSFFAAYELYFVNKENAHLWDHRARSMAECERRYGDCYYR